MKILKTTIAILALVVSATTAFAQAGAANLLGAKPDVVFWHPPYSNYQPTWASDGSLSLDLSQAAGQPMAVLKFEIPQGTLQPGKLYAFSLSAKAIPSGPMVINVPEPKADGSVNGKGAPQPNSAWNQIHGGWKAISVEFVYNPEVNDGTINFFWNKDWIGSGSVFSFKDMKIVALD